MGTVCGKSDEYCAASSYRDLKISVRKNTGIEASSRDEGTMRKLIAFDDETSAKLKQLARDRMATFQELADEAFADLLKKHGIPVDLKDALRKSAQGRRDR